MVVVVDSRPSGSRTVVRTEKTILSSDDPDNKYRRVSLARSRHSKSNAISGSRRGDLSASIGVSHSSKLVKRTAPRGPNFARFAENGTGRAASGGSRGSKTCLLYTSDAADDLLCVDLGGRRIIKK